MQLWNCKNNFHRILSIFAASILLFAGSMVYTPVSAADIDDLKNQISDRSQRIQELEGEIKEYEEDLQEIGEEKQTLQNAIGSLDVSRKKIGTDINLTETRIGTTNLEIQKIAFDVQSKEEQIATNQEAVASTLRTMNEIESDSLVEAVLAYENLGEVWERVETLERFQIAMREDIRELAALRDELTGKKLESEGKKQELVGYRNQLSGQKRVLDENRQEKDRLLSITKNEETNYQTLLAQKRAAREQFERELQDLEAQLEFALDPASIPPAGEGILSWPLDTHRVTQYFGNTPFAKSGAYDGRGHNGIDLGASLGTRVKAALGGTVVGIGNTDEVRGCYSYGKWALIKHHNGLSTLYAHLSIINVQAGQAVSTGEVIGFSGNTGYSTGPHLHFTVYLSDAVEIVRLSDIKSITNCGAARIPIAPLKAYLNPLDYLSS